MWQQHERVLQQQLLWRLLPVHLRGGPAHGLLHGREWHFGLPTNANAYSDRNGHTYRYANSHRNCDSHSYTNIDSYGYANHYTQRYANSHSYAYSPANAHCQA